MIAVELCSRTVTYPLGCPCCGAEPDAELSIALRASSRPRADGTARKVRVPYCRRCIEHVSAWETASAASSVLLLVGVVAAIGVGLSGGLQYAMLIIGGAIMLATSIGSMLQARARAWCTPACVCAGHAVVYYGWSGSASTFGFASTTYTARFAEANTSKRTVIRTRAVPAVRVSRGSRRSR